MSVCPLCGKRVIPNKGNATIVDGQLVHKNCNKNLRSASTPEEKQDRQELLDAISKHLALNPKGYVAETGLNFTKVGVQIGKLKKQGYSYKDQLYALEEVVKKQGGFYGYTAVCNNIAGIISKREKQAERASKMAEMKEKYVVTQQPLDLSRLMEESEEW